MKKILLLTTALLIMGCAYGAANLAPPPAAKPSPSPAAATATPTPAPPRHCAVTAYVLNLRANPNAQAAILQWLDHATDLTITGQSGNWYSVALPSGETGWVHAAYCDEQKN